MRTLGSHADQWRRLLFLPAASGRKAIDGRRETDSYFSSQVNASRPVNPQQNATSGNGLLRNTSKCSETFRNALAKMTYCLGHPAIAASNGPVGNQHPFCKALHNFVDICIRKQNFAELTPVHRFDGKNFKPPSGPKIWMGTLSAG